jgi:hypothetical protein
MNQQIDKNVISISFLQEKQESREKHMVFFALGINNWANNLSKIIKSKITSVVQILTWLININPKLSRPIWQNKTFHCMSMQSQ